MWSCKICSHKTSRRGNIVRHIKLVHGIDDRDGKNATKDSNKAAGMTSYGEDRLETQGIPTYGEDRLETLGIATYGEDRLETPACSNGFKQQSGMMGKGIPLSEERYLHRNSPELMIDLQDGGHYEKLARHQPRMISHQSRMEENEDSDKESEEDSEGDKRYQALPEQELTEEQIDKIYGDLKAKKRRILDCLLKIIPDHLNTKAKRMCDDLKNKDRLFILPSHEINIDGKTLRGSHIHYLVMHELLKPQTPDCIQFKLLEDKNKTLRFLLKHSVKAYERARGAPICRKFESMFDGTVEYFDDESDKSSGDDDDKEEEDSDKNEREDDDDDAGDSDDSENAFNDDDEDTTNEDDDNDEDEEEDEDATDENEPTPKKKKKKF